MIKNGTTTVALGAARTVSTGTWYHLAFVRSGDNWYAFENGVQFASANNSTAFPDLTGELLVGKMSDGRYFDGWLDEVRVSKGIAGGPPVLHPCHRPTIPARLSISRIPSAVSLP